MSWLPSTINGSGANNNWRSICYGDGLFVAVASSGIGNRVMTSPDGITWTTRTSSADNEWRSVCYGNPGGFNQFVAVSNSGTGNRVMTSPDGITWTTRASATNNDWRSVCYGNGLFVAVASSGPQNRVMTSPDGITWTSSQSASGNVWWSVCYGDGLFVAVSPGGGTGNRVMTSPDGITWTTRTSSADNEWRSVCYGNPTAGGLFVAVASSGIGNRVMTSPDSITWTSRQSASDNNWPSVCYGDGKFVAVSSTGDNRVMTSDDGITWTSSLSASDNNVWTSVSYGNATYSSVAVSSTNGTSLAMYNSSLICFLEKTKILIIENNREQYKSIECLKPGDTVKTYNEGNIRIHKINRLYFNNNISKEYNKKLYKYAKKNNEELTEDLIVTWGHSVLVDKLTETQMVSPSPKIKINDKYLLLAGFDEKAEIYDAVGECYLYHLCLESADKDKQYGVYANGKICETCNISTFEKMWGCDM